MGMLSARGPSPLRPRCIGSSKSACFLCDLFIAKHGTYTISHSHKRLYEKWTFPSSMPWMKKKKKQRFERIVGEMNVEILHLIAAHQKKRPGYEGNGPESIVHMLELGPGVRSVLSVGRSRVGSTLTPSRGPGNASSSTITPSRAKSTLIVSKNGISKTAFRNDGMASPVVPSQHDSAVGSTFSLTENHVVSSSIYSQRRLISPAPSQTNLHSSISSSRTDYSLHDLPLKIPIRESTFSHVLQAGSVEYVFDFERVDAGQLEICSGRGDRMVDVTGLGTERSTRVEADVGGDSLTFCLNGFDKHELRVTVTWEDS